MSGVILYLAVRESLTLYIYIYIFVKWWESLSNFKKKYGFNDMSKYTISVK